MVKERKIIVHRRLQILDKNNMTVKWEKFAIFQKEISWLGFKVSEVIERILVGKDDAKKTSLIFWLN